MDNKTPSAFSHGTGHHDEADATIKTAGNSSSYGSTGDNVVPFISKGVVSCPVPEKILTGTMAKATTSHHDHIATLSLMELRERYPREANSHKNMLSRQKTNGAIIHPDFVAFASFLAAMGPIPAKKATLDRIDNSDPEYAPGKVRWADKKTQNSNKSDTIVIHDAKTGKTYSVSQLAKLTGTPPDMIRKQKARGWLDAEIIAGTKAKPSTVPHLSYSGLPSHVAKLAAKVPPGLYSQQQLEKMAAHEAFYSDAAVHQTAREEDETGGYIIMTYDEAMTHTELMYSLDKEKYMKRYATNFWPGMRPHVVYSMLTPEHKKFFAELDPDWVEKEEEKLKKKQALAALL